MKAKFRLGNYLIIGIISFFMVSALFTGCGTNYDDDIDALNAKADSIANALRKQEEALAALQLTVSNLRTEINNLNTITNVTPNGTGFIISFSNGQQYTIESGQKGADGKNGTVWTINKEGHWVLVNAPGDSTVTKFPATGAPSPFIEDGKWVLHEWNTADSTFKPKPTDFLSKDTLNAYIVDKDTCWTLFTKPSINATKLDSINLPKYTSDNKLYASTIEVLDFGHAITEDDTYLEHNFSIALVFNRISIPIPGAWSGQRTLPTGTSNVILTNLIGNSLVIRAYPDNEDIKNTDFILVNTQGNELPIKLGKPVKIEGLLRSNSDGALYNIPLDVEPQAVSVAAYTNQMDVQAILKTKNTDKFKVKYQLLKFHPNMLYTGTTPTITAIGGKAVSNTGGVDKVDVTVKKTNRIEFNYGNSIYDYYVEVASDDISLFDITINKTYGTFKVNNTSSTKTSFTLTVQSLGLDGIKRTHTVEVTPKN